MHNEDHVPWSFTAGLSGPTKLVAFVMLVDSAVGVHSKPNVCSAFVPRVRHIVSNSYAKSASY